jgi:uncharacterized protein (TIGR00290 family)
MNKKKVIVSWSGGKDSAFCLYKINQTYEVVGLLSIVKEGKIPMHNTDFQLIKKQAQTLHLPLYAVKYTHQTQYEKDMYELLNNFKDNNIYHIGFGDIFLEDLRNYRQARLNELGMSALFPLWNSSTSALISDFISLGFKTVITNVDTNILNKDLVGTTITKKTLEKFNDKIDFCGENGEYHTFTYEGPLFLKSIQYQLSNFRQEKNIYTCDCS